MFHALIPPLPDARHPSYQGTIDWPAVAKSGVEFVSIKATESTDYTDPSFAKNWAGSHAAGLIRTAYHFAHPSVSAQQQASFFVGTVRAAGGWNASSTLPLMLDLEDADKLGPAAVWAWVQAFCADVKALTGKDVLIYVSSRPHLDAKSAPRTNTLAPTPTPHPLL